jgi:hypothetical protein
MGRLAVVKGYQLLIQTKNTTMGRRKKTLPTNGLETITELAERGGTVCRKPSESSPKRIQRQQNRAYPVLYGSQLSGVCHEQ